MIPFWTQAEELSICFKKKKQNDNNFNMYRGYL